MAYQLRLMQQHVTSSRQNWYRGVLLGPKLACSNHSWDGIKHPKQSIGLHLKTSKPFNTLGNQRKRALLQQNTSEHTQWKTHTLRLHPVWQWNLTIRTQNPAVTQVPQTYPPSVPVVSAADGGPLTTVTPVWLRGCRHRATASMLPPWHHLGDTLLVWDTASIQASQPMRARRKDRGEGRQLPVLYCRVGGRVSVLLHGAGVYDCVCACICTLFRRKSSER